MWLTSTCFFALAVLDPFLFCAQGQLTFSPSFGCYARNRPSWTALPPPPPRRRRPSGTLHGWLVLALEAHRLFGVRILHATLKARELAAMGGTKGETLLDEQHVEIVATRNGFVWSPSISVSCAPQTGPGAQDGTRSVPNEVVSYKRGPMP